MITSEQHASHRADTERVGAPDGIQSPLTYSIAGWRWVTSHFAPLLVTLLAMGLHLHRLDSHSLWLDELGTLYGAAWQGTWMDAIRLPLAIPGVPKPPLSFLITHLTLVLGDQVFLLRLPAALFATLTIPLVYTLGKALFARQVLLPGQCRIRSAHVGLLGALLLALAPLHIRYAQELRMYAMWAFLSTLSLTLFWRAIRSRAGSWWIAWTLVTGLALYTHLFTLLCVAVMALFGLWLLVRRSARVQFPFRAWHLLAALGLLALAYVPMVPSLAKGLLSADGLAGEPVQSWDLSSLQSALQLFSGGYGIGCILCVALLGVAAVALMVRGRTVLLLAAMRITLPASLLLLLPFGHRLWVRYLLCALPIYLLLAAYGLLTLSDWLGSWLGRRATPPKAQTIMLPHLATLLMAALLTGILLANSMASDVLYYAETKQNWRDATRVLCSMLEPGEPVYVRHAYYRTGVLYYAGQCDDGRCPLAEDTVQVLPRDLAEAFPPGGDRASWLIVPATDRFLPGGQVEAQMQPYYRYSEPRLFLSDVVPKESEIISPLTFRGVALVHVLPSEPASIRFWSDQAELGPGDCTWLRWDIDHVREVYLQDEGVIGHDQRQVCPRTTTRYELTVTHQDGKVTTHTVEIEVRGP